MSRSAVPAPRELADLPYAGALTPHEGGLGTGTEYDTVHFDRSDFGDADGSGSRFLECAFTGVSLHGGRLRRARFIDVWLKDLRMTLSDIAETQWTDATFIGGSVAGHRAEDAVRVGIQPGELAAGRPSRIRAPSGWRQTWMPDCLPGWVMIAGVVCRPPSSVVYRLGGRPGSGCTASCS